MSNNNKKNGEDDFFGHFCQNVRRFTDQHISSMLHSLIGLPSMVTPPAGGTWVIIDEELRPKKERAYGDGDGRLEGKTMEEIQKIKATWIAERDGGAGGVKVAEGAKAKAESGGSSSSPSSTSSTAPRSGRAIYVFRFPSSSSSSDGYSDYYSPDAQRQIERLNGQMLRSFHRDELFQFNPFPSLFGLLHPFMFSPFAGLPRTCYHGSRDPIEEGLDEFDQWRRMRDEELRWRRKVCGHYNSEYSRVEDKANGGVENVISENETQHPLPLQAPPEEVANPEPENELDLYEHLDLISSNDKSLPGRGTATRCITSTSTSTESRTFPNGSTFTKTVKITRYSDGTEERVENEHRTPQTDGNAIRTIQGNRRGVVGAEDDGRGSGEGPIFEVSSDRGFRGNEDGEKELHEFERRVFDYLMRSPFFEEARRAEQSDEEDTVIFTLPKQTPYEYVNKAKRSQEDENRATPNEPAAQSNDSQVEGRKWGWFWSK